MKRPFRKTLAALLALVMVLGLLPTAALAAEETGTFSKITTQEELTDGQYVMIVSNGYAPGVLDGTWLTAEQPVIEETTITDASLWTITVNGEFAELTDSNGVTI